MDSESKEEVQILDSNEVEAVPEAPPDIPQSEDANPLVRLRNCKGLSQRDFGALLGYPFPDIRSWKKGIGQPSRKIF